MKPTLKNALNGWLGGILGGFLALGTCLGLVAANAPGARLAAGRLFVGNASGVATAVDITGNVVISNAGVTSISTDLAAADLAADSVDTSEIAANAVAADEIATGAVGTLEIAANVIVSADVDTNFMQVDNSQLTNTNMLALEATPVTLIAAVATTAIVVHKVALFFDWTADYTESADNLVIEYADGTDIVVIEATGFVDAGADAARLIIPRDGAIVVVAAGGTACSATCDGTCIHGFDLAAGAEVPLACDGAGADTCTCYRPSVPVSNSAVRITTVGSGEYGGGNASNTMSIRIWYSEVPMAAFSSGG